MTTELVLTETALALDLPIMAADTGRGSAAQALIADLDNRLAPLPAPPAEPVILTRVMEMGEARWPFPAALCPATCWRVWAWRMPFPMPGRSGP
ncbi:MAG: hypothetical protein QM656_01805 [Paracoccaceae bacterium]